LEFDQLDAILIEAECLGKEQPVSVYPGGKREQMTHVAEENNAGEKQVFKKTKEKTKS
jgi:hypothetical protein